MDGERFEYTIDGNAGEGLENRAVGSWLWQHLAGVEVKHLFRALIERVRVKEKVIRVPFRCDAPALRREMMLEATPLEGEGVRFVTWVVEEEGRETVPLLEALRKDDPDYLLLMCAWCKRIGVGDDRWLEVEEAAAELHLFHMDPLPRITHGVCRECRTTMMEELGEAEP